MAQVAAALRKNLLLGVACCLSVILAAGMWSLGQRKTYRSEALLRLEADPPRPLGQRVELASPSSSYWNRREFYESEYRVIRSMRVATAVVRRLGLQGDRDFVGHAGATVEDAARILISHLSVEPVKDSSLATVRYEDHDAARAQRILTTLVNVYLEQNLENTSAVSANALEWLNGQLSHLKSELETSEKAVNEFREKNHVLTISFEDRHNIISAQLEELAKQKVTLDIRRIELASRKAELDKLDPKDEQATGVREIQQSPVVVQLRTTYAEEQRKLDELAANLGDAHPKVVAAKAKVAATRTAILAEIKNIRNAVVSDLRAIERQIADLKKNEDELQKSAHELQAFEVPYNQLVRTKANNEKIYSLVLERAREMDLTRMVNFNNIRVVDPPLLPQRPVRPNHVLDIAVGGVLGLALAVVLVMLRELTDRTIKSPQHAEEILGITCFGFVPRMLGAGTDGEGKPVNPDLIVAERPDSTSAEAMRAVRTNLMFASPDHPYRKVLVTSALPEEGKTTIACSLAIALAQGGLKVLLVDTDLRRPRIHRTFKMSNGVGVSMLIAGRATIEEATRPTVIENLDLLTAGPTPPNPAEMLQSESARALFEQLAAKYDRVIFDSPPMLPVTDATVMSRLVDGTLVVARALRTDRHAIAQALRQLRDINTPVIGLLLNGVDVRSSLYAPYTYYYAKYGARRDEVDDVKPVD